MRRLGTDDRDALRLGLSDQDSPRAGRGLLEDGAQRARARRPFRPPDLVGRRTRRPRNGLPDGFYNAVVRDGMCVDDGEPAGVYLGSRDGTVFASADEGESWNVVVEHLPDVLCVRAATLG